MIDSRTAPYAALRVSLGALFLARGLLLKVFTFTVPGTVQFFESIRYPGFFAYLVILGEIGGGLALILGLWTRPISLLLLPIMIGATLQHVGGGWLFTNQGGGWEFPVFWTVAVIAQALLGDGNYALRLPRFDRVGPLRNVCSPLSGKPNRAEMSALLWFPR